MAKGVLQGCMWHPLKPFGKVKLLILKGCTQHRNVSEFIESWYSVALLLVISRVSLGAKQETSARRLLTCASLVRPHPNWSTTIDDWQMMCFPNRSPVSPFNNFRNVSCCVQLCNSLTLLLAGRGVVHWQRLKPWRLLWFYSPYFSFCMLQQRRGCLIRADSWKNTKGKDS